MRIGEALKEISANNVTLAEKQQQVYDAGVAEGRAQGGYTEGFDAGRQAEYDAFWDVFQGYGNRRYYNQTFYNSTKAGQGWTDETFNPKYPIVTDTGYNNNIFAYCSFTDTKVEIDLSASASAQGGFLFCTMLKTIRKVTLPTDENANLTNIFYRCDSLENIVFGGEIVQTGISFQWSTNLSRESITNIINALSLNVADKTMTFSKTAVNKAFETSEGANDGNTSAEWLNLIATKPGWTISLV